MNINTFSELFDELRSAHFYPKIMTEVSAKKEVITGLSIYCSPLLKENNIERVQEIIGEKFVADFIPNINEIHITIKATTNDKTGSNQKNT